MFGQLRSIKYRLIGYVSPGFIYHWLKFNLVMEQLTLGVCSICFERGGLLNVVCCRNNFCYDCWFDGGFTRCPLCRSALRGWGLSYSGDLCKRSMQLNFRLMNMGVFEDGYKTYLILNCQKEMGIISNRHKYRRSLNGNNGSWTNTDDVIIAETLAVVGVGVGYWVKRRWDNNMRAWRLYQSRVNVSTPTVRLSRTMLVAKLDADKIVLLGVNDIPMEGAVVIIWDGLKDPNISSRQHWLQVFGDDNPLIVVPMIIKNNHPYTTINNYGCYAIKYTNVMGEVTYPMDDMIYSTYSETAQIQGIFGLIRFICQDHYSFRMSVDEFISVSSVDTHVVVDKSAFNRMALRYSGLNRDDIAKHQMTHYPRLSQERLVGLAALLRARNQLTYYDEPVTYVEFRTPSPSGETIRALHETGSFMPDIVGTVWVGELKVRKYTYSSLPPTKARELWGKPWTFVNGRSAVGTAPHYDFARGCVVFPEWEKDLHKDQYYYWFYGHYGTVLIVNTKATYNLSWASTRQFKVTPSSGNYDTPFGGTFFRLHRSCPRFVNWFRNNAPLVAHRGEVQWQAALETILLGPKSKQKSRLLALSQLTDAPFLQQFFRVFSFKIKDERLKPGSAPRAIGASSIYGTVANISSAYKLSVCLYGLFGLDSNQDGLFDTKFHMHYCAGVSVNGLCDRFNMLLDEERDGGACINGDDGIMVFGRGVDRRYFFSDFSAFDTSHQNGLIVLMIDCMRSAGVDEPSLEHYLEECYQSLKFASRYSSLTMKPLIDGKSVLMSYTGVCDVSCKNSLCNLIFHYMCYQLLRRGANLESLKRMYHENGYVIKLTEVTHPSQLEMCKFYPARGEYFSEHYQRVVSGWVAMRCVGVYLRIGLSLTGVNHKKHQHPNQYLTDHLTCVTSSYMHDAKNPVLDALLKRFKPDKYHEVWEFNIAQDKQFYHKIQDHCYLERYDISHDMVCDLADGMFRCRVGELFRCFAGDRINDRDYSSQYHIDSPPYVFPNVPDRGGDVNWNFYNQPNRYEDPWNNVGINYIPPGIRHPNQGLGYGFEEENPADPPFPEPADPEPPDPEEDPAPDPGEPDAPPPRGEGPEAEEPEVEPEYQYPDHYPHLNPEQQPRFQRPMHDWMEFDTAADYLKAEDINFQRVPLHAPRTINPGRGLRWEILAFMQNMGSGATSLWFGGAGFLEHYKPIDCKFTDDQIAAWLMSIPPSLRGDQGMKGQIAAYYRFVLANWNTEVDPMMHRERYRAALIACQRELREAR